MNFLEQIDVDYPISDFHFSFDRRFGESYASYHGGQYRLFKFQGKERGYISVLLKKSKFFKTAQLLYQPVKENGKCLEAPNEQEVLDHFAEHLKKQRLAHRIVQGPNWALFAAFPKKAKACNFGSYRLNLMNKVENEIWKNLHSKHRNVIRNAEKSGAKIVVGPEQVTVFHKLYAHTMERNRLPYEPVQFFQNMIDTYPGIYCATVYHNNEALGALFAPYTHYGAYYLYGASNENITLTGAINLLHYKFISFLIEQNVMVYDFVGARLSDVTGTRYEGIQKFKARFGGELARGYLWKMDLNLPMCKLYDTLLGLKLRLSGNFLNRDIIDQETSKPL